MAENPSPSGEAEVRRGAEKRCQMTDSIPHAVKRYRFKEDGTRFDEGDACAGMTTESTLQPLKPGLFTE